MELFAMLTQILADQLNLSQPEGANYDHQIILSPQDLDLNMALDQDTSLDTRLIIQGHRTRFETFQTNNFS